MFQFVDDVLHSLFGRAFIVVMAVFAVMATFIPGPLLGQVFNPIALAVCGAVGIIYAPDFETVLRCRKPTRADWLGAGIAVGWFSSAALKADGIFVTLGQYWILTGPSHNFLLLLQIVGGACHLIAPQADLEGRVTRRASIVLALAVGTGCALSLGLLEANALHWIDTPNFAAPHDIAPRVRK